ncbi:MAG: hypothetical protein K0Q79_540 [Flavipsychrobacter sp.]|jgi:hypothetical protein|nr:hypothetical protein [Flavipsychrobacter sp.]
MGTSGPRNYKYLTIKRLYSLSGNRCAFPNCTQTFLNSDDEDNFSNICHIEDANLNTHKADGYNAQMTNAERSDYKNLILLCPNHHIETNDPEKYPADVLRKMKRDHENKMDASNNGLTLSKNPSIISQVVNQIGTTLLAGNSEADNSNAPKTEEKIQFNNIVRYKPLIEEYSAFQGKLNSVYEEIEKQGSSKKDFLLQNIRTLYLKEKGKYFDIHEIRANADTIFESIENEIWKVLENSNNFNKDLPIEALNTSVMVIMVDAFMRCKILEEPTNK